MRLGVLSDFHGNVTALQVALQCLAEVGVEQVVALGDTVGYIPSVAVVRELRRRGIECLRGNHEVMLLEAAWSREQDAVYRFSEIFHLLDQDDWSWIRRLPERLEKRVDGCRLLFVHGSPVDPVKGYVYPDTDLETVRPKEAVDVVFMGNTHRPFIRQHGDTLFVNVGSCGFPRDNVAKGCACVFDTVSFRADLLRFPISESARVLRERFRLHPSVDAYLKRYISEEDG